MATIKDKFDDAANRVKGLKVRPSDKDLLDLYALYKQATDGDNNNSKPIFMNLKQNAKHAAWLALKGTSSEDAMKLYIAKVDALIKELATN